MFSDVEKNELIRRRPQTERVDLAAGSHDAHLDAFDEWIAVLRGWLTDEMSASVALEGRVFAGVSNAETGQVDAATRFHYHEDGPVVWAEYSGGEIVRGYLVGTRAGDRLSFRYVHLAADGATASGVCDSRIRVLADGRVRFEESWAWESRPETGTSIVEEIR